MFEVHTGKKVRNIQSKNVFNNYGGAEVNQEILFYYKVLIILDFPFFRVAPYKLIVFLHRGV